MPSDLIVETLKCRDNNKIGRLILNRPKRLNALSLSMIDALQSQLDAWKTQKDIVAIIIQGNGDKAFCAGGDVQAVYRAVKEENGQPASDAARFFTEEYRLDASLHSYPKPVIAWGSGYVMGGGLGIFMGADFRIATQSTVAAMPEVSIGLYPDVGMSYFLNRMPDHCGRFLALTGATLNAADCLEMDIATHFVTNNSYKEVIEFLREQTWSEDNAENTEVIDEVIESFAFDAEEKLPESDIDICRPDIQTLCHDDDTHQVIDNILTHKSKHPWFKEAQATLSAGSCLSAVISDRHLKETRSLSLDQVFEKDLMLSTRMLELPDFFEGVRARLVDKDNQPDWQYKHHRDIPDSLIDSLYE